MKKKTSVFDNALIWFGAGVSIAEIITGTYFAGLGWQKGLLAILIGHFIGGALMFLSGLIGGITGQSSMETVKVSFGIYGGKFFSVLNIIQLLGWTSIMIYDGSVAASGLFSIARWVWVLVIGLLILIWIFVGITNLGKLNSIAVLALFVLSVFLSVFIFSGLNVGKLNNPVGDSLSFGAAIELSAAMPVSWLPLISDYTREAKSPIKATWVSCIVYVLVSIWMYIVGMGAEIITRQGDIASIILKAGLGFMGLAIVVFSTVTTTFLDAWSAGISTESLSSKISGKYFAIITTVLGTAGALLFPMDDISNFLYLIGSVFVPMIAIQITDFYVLHREFCDTQNSSFSKLDVKNFIIWIVGFVCYRVLMRFDIPFGNTILDIAITMVLSVILHKEMSEK